MAKKANPCKTCFSRWCRAVAARGVVAVPPPSYMKDWPGMKTDMLSLLDMKYKMAIRSLVRVAFGKQAKVDICDDRHGYSILIWPDSRTMVCVAIGYMREGPRINKRYIDLSVPDLELQRINGRDLGWAYWLHKQMPRVRCYYPGC